MNRGTLARLRDLVPIRALTHGEALRIAELQATRFLALSEIAEPPVPESIITRVPKIEVRRISPWAVSGCTDWTKGTWLIVIRGSETGVRQRFTIAHEFKHILDHRFVHLLYPTTRGVSAHQRAESVCDYFAGCLLVPKVWLKRAWGNGSQDIGTLARSFGVSQAAMKTRLLQTGLITYEDRCGTTGGYERRRDGAKADRSPGVVKETLM
jgi:hypothetical protein